MAIEFFNKVLGLKPDMIVYYCKTEFFLRPSVHNFVESKYKIVSHIFSNAKTAFKLSEWPISQVIFEKPNFQAPVIARSEATKQSKKASESDGLLRLSARNGVLLTDKYDIKNGDFVTADRYELNPKTEQLEFAKTYTYDNKNPNLIKEIEKKIWENNKGFVLGQWTNQNYCIVLSNRTDNKQKITAKNLKYCLLLKGTNFNTHGKYFEKGDFVFRGTIGQIPPELFSDAVMFSLFYKGILFTNKNQKNYIMPFTSEELGCAKNDLNVHFPKNEADLFSQESDEKPFDFREFLHQFEFSEEAKELYKAALEVFRFYHKLDSKDDRRITKVKTTKGTRRFGRNSIKYAISSKDLPLFENFFDARDVLAKKINKELLDAGLLLWERENIY